MTSDRSAPALLRAVGLMADGPIVWGRPLPPVGAGVFLVELAAPQATAPLELDRVGKWIERVEGLRLDGERPTSKALYARLAAFWLPSEPVLYIGATEQSLSRRVASLTATVLGERRPHSGGHWLHALRMPAGTRIWWAATSAVEEYEDALLTAFADGLTAAERQALPDGAVLLPFANLRRPTGERKATGLTGSLIPEPVAAPRPPTRVVTLPDGAAEGANGEPPAPKRRAAATPARRATAAGATPRPRASKASAASRAGETDGVGAATPLNGVPDTGALTPDGAARLRAELENLTKVRRPEVIARIRAAKELGDLKENADYTAAREEQSFLEGRVQALEARLRTAVIVEAPAAGARIGLGSIVTVEVEDESIRYTIVGSSDADVAAGRISSSSPVGRALMGHGPGDEIVIGTPAGNRAYRIVAVD